MTDSKPSNNCPDCGSEIPAESPDAICPACLMKQAFATRTANQGKKTLSPPPSPEEIADKFPQFEITECLGQGGMGVVYKARQKSLNRWVAIKTLAPERLENDHFAERFSREAQTLALLSHPNIVTVHDYGETDGLFYIVMEYVDGVNLRDLLHDGKMDSAQALSIVPPICEALQYAHDKGIVHRDIKPENLLIDREGRVKIADFGIASLVGDTNEKSGTPPYMAPEQGSHEDVDHRADIYALGVVLYEMLTGERPATPLNLPSQKVQLDIRIDDIVLRAINKEPERRYRTAEEFRTVVENISVQTHSNTPPPITASAPVIPPMPTKQRGMFRRWWWILLISILLGPVIGFFGNIFLRDLSPKKFEASAIVEVRPKNISESLSNFPQELFEELLTQENLEQLVDRHELKKRWKLSNKDTISKLRKSIQIQQVRGTDLIEVRVAAENANLAPLIANSFVEIAGKKQTSAQFIVHDKATRSAQPTALWIQGTRGILISVALGLLIVPLLALAVMAMLHRMIPDRSSAIHHPELSGEQKARRTFYGKVSLWLLLTAILGTLAMMTLSHRDEMALTFGVFALLLSIIFWVMSRYRRLLIILIILAIIGSVLISLFIVFLYVKPTAKEQAVSTAIVERQSQILEARSHENPDKSSDTDYKKVALEFMRSIQTLDVDGARPLLLESAFPTLFPELSKEDRAGLERDFSDITQQYASSRKRMLLFSQWYRDGDFAVGRLTPPYGETKTSPYLILQLTADGWKIASFGSMESSWSINSPLGEYLENR